MSSPGKWFLVSNSRTSSSHELEELGIVDRVALVEEDDDVGDFHLAGEQDVLAGLGHGPSSRPRRGPRRPSGRRR